MVVNPVGHLWASPRGPVSSNRLLLAAARGEIEKIVDAPVGWVLTENAAAGHLLVLERGELGRRYVLREEVAPFGGALHGFAEFVDEGLALTARWLEAAGVEVHQALRQPVVRAVASSRSVTSRTPQWSSTSLDRAASGNSHAVG
jgi:hypothetical protein